MISPFLSSQLLTATVKRLRGSPVDQSIRGEVGLGATGIAGGGDRAAGAGFFVVVAGVEAGRPRFSGGFGGRPGPGGGGGGDLKKLVSGCVPGSLAQAAQGFTDDGIDIIWCGPFWHI
mmetsp:Transcript_23801/g.54149  ORF Transcript_23801/g.54149 Transcript_23801/m.54149 type:complete len:118 (+) Transcript_23801:501-854(+)